jgi:inner membrane protein
MPTIFTHAVAGASLAQALSPCAHRRGVTIAAALLAMLPDIDVLGFRWGISYGDMLGHRGLTHSLLFAGLVSLVAVTHFWKRANVSERFRIALCIAVTTASHGFLDAFTNGGLGVAFLSPFNTARYFFPVTPIAVSPIGVQAFLTERGASVMASELIWVWCPALVLALAATLIRNGRAKRVSMTS